MPTRIVSPRARASRCMSGQYANVLRPLSPCRSQGRLASVVCAMPRSTSLTLAAVALAVALIAPASALATVSISRAEFSSGSLRIEGSAFMSRPITVDGVAMTTSSSGGTFKISRSGFTAPADCTVDVNDGAPTPVAARLSGCTATSTAPPPTSTLAFASETGSFVLGGEALRVVTLEVGNSANRFFNGSGGTLPYRWAATGTLPPGWSVIQDNPAGPDARLGGTLTAAGTYVFTLTLTDARGSTVSHQITANVSDGSTLPGATGVTSVALSASSLTGGGSTTGTVTLGAPAPAGGAFVSLTSDNRTVASVPNDSITIPAGATTGTFTVNTTAVTASTPVGIEALYTTSRTARLTVNPSATAPADPVSIGRAEYDSSKRTIRIEATSNTAGATLRAYVTSTGALLGTLSSGGGTFSAASNPQSITVRS